MIPLLQGFDQTQLFYFNRPQDGIIYSVVDGKVVVDHSRIEQLKTYKIVIADMSSENWGDMGTINMIYDLLDSHGITFVMLSHALQDHQQRPHLYFYPYWYYQTLKQMPKAYKIAEPAKYKISCLFGSPRPHRIYNWFKFIEQPYYKDCYASIYHNETSHVNRNDDIILDSSTIEKWEELKPTLLVRDENYKLGPKEIFDITGPAYSNSYINFVTEPTIISRLMISEKSWKTIANGQLFVIFGGVGIVDYLRNQGVDVFDDIIDHKYYDNEPDWQVRLSKIYTVLDSIVEQDLAHLYQRTQVRRQLNQENFFNRVFDNNYRNQILKVINSHV